MLEDNNANLCRPLFSICVPAYNRARFLGPLLDSIFAQSTHDFEVVICEDRSPERDAIRSVVERYRDKWPGKIQLFENEQNLGYDGNVRNLIAKSSGRFCFFMGNDDLLVIGALEATAKLIAKYPDLGFVLKSYAWFDRVPEVINQEVKYFGEERVWDAGVDAISVCFRRAGVISGFIIDRDAAHAAATDEFDGSLYYQMHLVGQVTAKRRAAFTPKVLVLSRNSEAPDFGISAREKGKYTPGGYTPEARIHMLTGVISILEKLEMDTGLPVKNVVMSDYASYFYPYIRDQLGLPLGKYAKLYRGFGALGFFRFPMFHIYFLICYLLGADRFDALTRVVRRSLGRTPQFGKR